MPRPAQSASSPRTRSANARGKLEGSYGNYDAYRVRATIETPQIGPFSAYFSFVRNYSRGDIKNAGAGLAWSRAAVAPGAA